MRIKGSLVIVIAALAAVTYSCGVSKTIAQSDTYSESGAEDRMVIEEKSNENPDYSKGLALIQENDCPSCHMENRKSVGPSYVTIASKYKVSDENINHLATRIIKGSVGIWGEIPMTSHSSLSREDAEQMVKYILVLNK